MLDSIAAQRLARHTPDAPPSDCWEWTGGRFGSGYGYVCFDRGVHYAHRVAYTLAKGRIPDGWYICHTCDNPPCVNPAHLFAGTASDNHADMMSKGRSARGVTNGHAKIDEHAVRAIRAMNAEGVPQPVIAAQFGVTQSTVSLIANRRRWQHVV